MQIRFGARPVVSLLAALGSGGCAAATSLPASVVSVMDFTEYTAQGFMFTPVMYQGDYESIGLIQITVFGECNFSPTSREEIWERECTQVGAQDALRATHREAVTLGANAVVNLQVKSLSTTVKRVRVPGVEVTGFAIRRKGGTPETAR